MAIDIAQLVKGKPQTEAAKSHSERMNQMIAEHDKELINNWHPHRKRQVWPKGISK